MYKIKRYFSNIKYGTKIIFASSKKYFLMKLIVSSLISVLPYIPLFLWRNLLNALVEYISGNNENLVKTIVIFTLLYCALIIVEKVLATVSEFVSFKYNDAISYYLDNLMIDKVTKVDIAFFDSSDFNDKLKNSWSIVYSIQSIVWMIFDMLKDVLRLIVSFYLLCTLSIWLVPVVIILCIPYIIGNKNANEADYRFEKEHSKSYRKMEYYKDVFFGNTRQEIKLYSLNNYFKRLYETEWEIWNKARNKKNMQQSIVSGIGSTILILNEVIVYVLSITKLLTKEMSVGDVVYYISILTQFRSDFTDLCSTINTFTTTYDEIEDVRSFIELKPLLEKSGTAIPNDKPRIEFKNVSFRYPNTDKYVLRNCSFIVRQGETVGLVGLNGSGKSTIIKLLLRFYDPCEGQILIDGLDSREYDIVKLRALFGVLFQDYVRYSFTVRENIAMSDISRIDNDQNILVACDRSKVTEIIREWENGIDENLTRRFDVNGKELSGGQWQRISLARAFFRTAPVVLLDEPSAALDPVAEHDIFERFSELSGDKSAVLISHRLSNITLVDKILVLEEGKIIEQGSHNELIRNNGRYAYLFNLQASKYI